MNKIEIIVNKLIKMDNVNDILRAMPGSIDNKYDFISISAFYNYIYSPSSKADETVQSILDKHQLGSRVCFIVGYKGCGKTTFLNYIPFKTNGHSVYISFDGLRTTEVSKKITNSLHTYIYSYVEKDILKNKAKTTKKLMDDCYNKKYRPLLEAEAALSEVRKLFDDIYEWGIIGNSSYQSKFNAQLGKLTIDNLLLVLFIWKSLECNVKSNKRQIYFLLDNLDAVDSPRAMNDFVEGLSNFISNVLMLINQNKLPAFLRKCFDLSNFIVSMRETTLSKIQSKFNEHFMDREPDILSFYEISEFYRLNEIIKQRILFLSKKTEANKNAQIMTISDIVNNNILANYISDLVNRDYRTSVQLLSVCADKFNRALKKLSPQPKLDDYCLRGIVYRYIFDLFSEKGYFEKLHQTEYSTGNGASTASINIARLVLEFLRNQNMVRRGGYPVRKKYKIGGNNEDESLISLKDAFDGICEVSDIARAICVMYSLRNLPYWNHLVTFDGLEEVEQEVIERILMGEITEGTIVPGMRITCAGMTYLTRILTQFEYYSARVSHHNDGEDAGPLFLQTSLEKDSTGRYMFETTITDVIREVRDCCKRLTNFYKNSIINKGDDYCNNYNRHFLYDAEYSGNQKYHGELIINEHINYIDNFRRYLVCEVLNHEDFKIRQDINNLLIDKILDYMAILGFNKDGNASRSQVTTVVSKQTSDLCEVYWDRILIIRNSNDFTISIEKKSSGR